ncbi:MAG TPA: hypothetical protein VEX35_12775 [Allosphingosinicella sp.]|nr:hypothetical protein [Allosphingosinicella sp.]
MTVPKRKRGRPPGTGLDDSRTLRAMAELLAGNARLKPTPAIRQVMLAPNGAEIRRLQAKWKKEGPQLLAAAHARRRTREEIRRRQQTEAFWQRVRAQQEAASNALSSAVCGHFGTMRAVRAMLDSPEVRLAREMANSPEARLAREMYNSPEARLAREMYNSPEARFAREMYNSPEARLVREMYDSSTMRAARELMGVRSRFPWS